VRRANSGETRSEREYIRVSHLTRLRDAYRLLADVLPSIDPNVPEGEYRWVMQRIDGWIANLENRRKGH